MAVPGPSAKSPTDFQLPICGLTTNCFNAQIDGSSTRPCKTTDLKCICKIDNDLSFNTLFNPPCLYSECFNDMGREEWLDAFAYACKEVNNPLKSVPSTWSRYLPEWYNNTSALPPPAPSPTASSPTSTAAIAPPSSPRPLSAAAIGGITLTCTFIFFGIIILIIVHLRTRKTAKRKSKQVAVLQDQLSPDGFSQRIRDIWATGRVTPRPGTPHVAGSAQDFQMNAVKEHYTPKKDVVQGLVAQGVMNGQNGLRLSSDYGDGYGGIVREEKRGQGYGEGSGHGYQRGHGRGQSGGVDDMQIERMSQATTWVDSYGSPYASPYGSPGIYRGENKGGADDRLALSPRTFGQGDVNHGLSLRDRREN